MRGGGVDGVDHHLARGRGGDGGVVDGGQDGGHHPGSLQSVELDQEEDEEKAHAKHLKRIKYIFPIQFKRKYMQISKHPNYPCDGVAGDVEISRS